MCQHEQTLASTAQKSRNQKLESRRQKGGDSFDSEEITLLNSALFGALQKMTQRAERCVLGITNNDVVEGFDFEKLAA